MKLDPKKFEIPSRTTYKLELVKEVAEKLKHPELGRPTILVAGTNGKGSTCAFLTALLMASGKRVGTYSSPHVVHPEERIRLNGKPIARNILRAVESELGRVLSELTYFERWTILAFEIFRREKVDAQVIEVGIGGRLDATNICDPDVSLIATIDDDHKDVLGPTLRHIAFEKSGIMRSGRKTFALPQRASARSTMIAWARTVKSDLEFVSKRESEVAIEKIFKRVKQDLGEHQEWNARLAWSGFKALAERRSWKTKVTAGTLSRCFLSSSLWPARFQRLHSKPVVIVDGAHNEQAIRKFVSRIQRLYRRKKFSVVFGVMKDKPISKMLKILSPISKRILAPVFYPERQVEPAELASPGRRLKIEAFPSTEEALSSLWKPRTRPTEDFLVVGSFYLAGDVLRHLEQRKDKLWEPRT